MNPSAEPAEPAEPAESDRLLLTEQMDRWNFYKCDPQIEFLYPDFV